ncbi:MAG: hypothetical protein QM541_08480 [Flavobacterium sp.]|nr:hypothetical protein [Flavobacterium sp.]
MIQITRKEQFATPTILAEKGSVLVEKMKAEYAAGVMQFEIDRTVYADANVKATLVKIQNYKCCYCEAKIGHIDDGDVEHFRPKKAYKQSEDDELHRPGYYWLSYDWDNLLLACTKCNGRNKENLFPIMETSVRASSHLMNVGDELPVFIHPVLENPELFITFDNNVPKPIDGNYRGRMTIKYLGLDRPLLNEDRGEKLDDLKLLFTMFALIPNTPPELKARAFKNLKKQFDTKTIETAEYAGMFRAFFKKYPISV